MKDESTETLGKERTRRGWWTALVALAALVVLVDVPALVLLARQQAIAFPFYADAFLWDPANDAQPVRRLSSGQGIFYQPCIRPDGQRIVFAGANWGAPRIWVADARGGAPRALSTPDAAALHPVYSWDGRTIAYTSDAASAQPTVGVHELTRGGRPTRVQPFHLYVMDGEGGPPRQLTRGRVTDMRPSFSPDGRHLVFVSNRERKFDSLWIVPTDGSEEPRLVFDEHRVYRPWYAADGTALFCHQIGSDVRHRILRIPLDGGEPVEVAPEFFESAHGSFAEPHGRSLLVHAERDERWNVWEISLDAERAPTRVDIPGFEEAYHATRGIDGRLAFDVPRWVSRSRELTRCVRFLR